LAHFPDDLVAWDSVGFAQVAVHTGCSEVPWIVGPTVTHGDDVIYV